MAVLAELKRQRRQVVANTGQLPLFGGPVPSPGLDNLRVKQRELVARLNRGLDLIAQAKGQDDAHLLAHFEKLLREYEEVSDRLLAQGGPDALRCEACPHRGQPPRIINSVAILCDTPCTLARTDRGQAK